MSNDRTDADIDVLVTTMGRPTVLAAGILPGGAVHLESPPSPGDRRVDATVVLEEFR